MIEILWNDEVHYRRESPTDPIVIETEALIKRHKEMFGFSHYKVRYNKPLAPEAEKSGEDVA